MKKTFIFLLFTVALLCSCTANNHENTNNTSVVTEVINPTPIEINETQMSDIYDKVSQFTSGENMTGYLDDIYGITSSNEVRKIEVNENIFYYNIFEYNGNNLVLIYDQEYWVCGCIYYNATIDLQKLKTAVSFEDVENVDTTLLNNGCGLNQLSALTLISQRQYSLNSTSSDTLSSTLHYTDKGLYLITYNKSLYTEKSSDIKVASLEKVEDPVYNKVYKLLCE